MDLKKKVSHYNIQEDNKSRSYIALSDNKNIHFYVQKGLIVNTSSLKEYPSCSIFVDGVFDGRPFLDNEKQQYSLDHHKGVVRAFTLAACEQALLMLLKGFTLEDGVWEIYGNEPDLDTVLTFWIFANYHRILDKDKELFRELVKFVRVEGLIDSQGFSMLEFSGYGQDVLSVELQRIDKAMEKEKQLKESGKWEDVDFLTYTQEILNLLDGLFLKVTTGEEELPIEELETIHLKKGYFIKISKSRGSILDVERILKEKYEGQLAILILQQAPEKYTMKICNEFIGKNLIPFYEALNKHDSAVILSDPSSVWGGSDTIGGSPRNGYTALSLKEIITLAKEVFVFEKNNWMKKIKFIKPFFT